MTEYIIETKNLTKKFGDLVAVNGLDLKVKRGTIHGFIGPNGAGKSTTMKMLIGAIRPTSGTATIKASKIGTLGSRKVFGFSPEHPHFYNDMTSFEYLNYMGCVSGLSSKEAEKRAAELLKWLDLSDFSNKKVGGFSAGMQQKLSLAQAMIHNPELLILDEPTANLDPAGRVNIIKKLMELSKKHDKTIFISSHILSELEKMVDDVTIISHGKVVTESKVKDLEAKYAGNEYLLKVSNAPKVLARLKASSVVSKAWLDEAGTIHIMSAGDEMKFKQKIARIVAMSNAALEAFGVSSNDLEQIFMKLVGESDQKMKREKKKFDFFGLFKKKKREEK